MKQITIYRDDMNSMLHGNLFDSLLEDLGIETHALVDGRYIKKNTDSVTITVKSAVAMTETGFISDIV